MADENSFLLVNLKEESSKDIAKVIGSDTCRKILDFLANNADSTETEISDKLNLPISTVHYNLKHLVKGNLVIADEYHYSEKGKEVSHYKLANKFIIIAPQETKENKNIFQKLKDIIPLSIFTVIAAGILFIQQITNKKGASYTANKVMESADYAIAPIEAKIATEEVLYDTVQATGARAIEAESTMVVVNNEPNYIIWFIAGAVSIIIFFALYKIIRHYIQKKSKNR